MNKAWLEIITQFEEIIFTQESIVKIQKSWKY